MKQLTIDLTAPEVHPPQRIEMWEDASGKQSAIITGLVLDDDGNLVHSCSIATWKENGSGTLFLDEQLNYPGTACWYLGWAFADIAREAMRIGATFNYPSGEWTWNHPRVTNPLTNDSA